MRPGSLGCRAQPGVLDSRQQFCSIRPIRCPISGGTSTHHAGSRCSGYLAYHSRNTLYGSRVKVSNESNAPEASSVPPPDEPTPRYVPRGQVYHRRTARCLAHVQDSLNVLVAHVTFSRIVACVAASHTRTRSSYTSLNRPMCMLQAPSGSDRQRPHRRDTVYRPPGMPPAAAPHPRSTAVKPHSLRPSQVLATLAADPIAGLVGTAFVGRLGELPPHELLLLLQRAKPAPGVLKGAYPTRGTVNPKYPCQHHAHPAPGRAPGSLELAACGVALSIFNTATKLFNVPLLSVTTSTVAAAAGREDPESGVAAAASASVLLAVLAGLLQVCRCAQPPPACHGLSGNFAFDTTTFRSHVA
jgi:hypothetical protein